MKGGEMDASTIRLSVTDAALVEERDHDARGNLAAIFFDAWGIDTVAEAAEGARPSLRTKACAQTEQLPPLLNMLGLSGQPVRTTCRRPGCGAEIPAWRRRDPKKSERHGGQDYCTDRCRNMHHLRGRSDV